MNRSGSSTRSRGRALATLLTLFASLAFGGARAADLPDPTRPPPSQRRAAAVAPLAAASTPAPLLQSVLIGGGRKPTAIINGRVVELGDPFNDMRLTRLTGNAAVLTGAHGTTTTLVLTPAADKLAPGSPAAHPGTPKTMPPSLTFRVAEQK